MYDLSFILFTVIYSVEDAMLKREDSKITEFA